jgi:hypothetical protein
VTLPAAAAGSAPGRGRLTGRRVLVVGAGMPPSPEPATIRKRQHLGHDHDARQTADFARRPEPSSADERGCISINPGLQEPFRAWLRRLIPE